MLTELEPILPSEPFSTWRKMAKLRTRRILSSNKETEAQSCKDLSLPFRISKKFFISSCPSKSRPILNKSLFFQCYPLQLYLHIHFFQTLSQALFSTTSFFLSAITTHFPSFPAMLLLRSALPQLLSNGSKFNTSFFQNYCRDP